MTRTGKSQRLSTHIGEPFAEINPSDAARLKIGDADIVEVLNERGRILVRALLTNRQQTGALFVPMHWTDEFASLARVDTLVASDVDPISGQPALKASRTTVRPFTASQYGFVICRDKPKEIEADYWALAVCDGGWRVELASSLVSQEPMVFARQLVSASETTQALAYQDRETGSARVAFFQDDVLLGAVFLSSSPVEVSRSWAVEQLGLIHRSAAERFRLLAGRAGSDQPDKGAMVCACFSIGVNQISAAVRSGECGDVDAIGHLLKAGTNCGSCRTEIKGIIDAHRLVAVE